MENRPFGRLVSNHGKRVLLSDYESKKKLLARNEIVKNHLDEQIVQLTKDHLKKITDIDDLILEDKKKLMKAQSIEKSLKLVEKANLGYCVERKRLGSVKTNNTSLREDAPSQPAMIERAPFHGKNVRHIWKEEATSMGSRSESFTDGSGARLHHKPIIKIHAPSSSVDDDISEKEKDRESPRKEQIFQQGYETDPKMEDLPENKKAEWSRNFEGSVVEAKETKIEMHQSSDLECTGENQRDAVFHAHACPVDKNVDNLSVVRDITLPRIHPLNLRQTKSSPSTFLRLPNINENSSSYDLAARRKTYTEGIGSYVPNSTRRTARLGRRNTIGTTSWTRNGRIESNSLNICSQGGSYCKKKFISQRLETQASSTMKGKNSRGKIPKDGLEQEKSLSELFKEMEMCHYLRVTRRTDATGSAEI